MYSDIGASPTSAATRRMLTAARPSASARATAAAAMLDALDWADAHVLGISKGGVVAQFLAVRHPARVRTPTSVMSFSSLEIGNRSWPEGIMVPDLAASMRAAVAAMRSPGFPADEEFLENTLRIKRERGWDLPRALWPAIVAEVRALADRAR
ncbi:alpha/beta fold hydrolase [Kutzneria albida]|uniref:alpha/beta fold hydrolase n=1 Tax=Kutzneria albida TaxID=43357 RepID=UPI0004B4AEB0|nr:hypothetical protein [Kutzneria albida]